MRQKPKNPAINSWYDLVDDWPLIESSFAMQYGIRFDSIIDMTWEEFKVLLIGISYKTPLGQIVSIRSEEDKDILKHFTREQMKIRSDWRLKINNRMSQNKEDYKADMEKIQEAFKRMFS